VRFAPVVPQDELSRLYSAADALLLTSTREGWPNVVLEALACGTPVVGVDVGAVAEMLSDSIVGRVVAQRDASQLAAAVRSVLQAPPERARVRRHAEQFDWASIARAQLDVFDRALGATQPTKRVATPPTHASVTLA
jgi:glycosyltransferase involved in cell wall biosynthesis